MDYTKRAALICCSSFLILAAMSFIPPIEIYGVELRRANVLSDLFTFAADNEAQQVELLLDEVEYEVDFEQVEIAVTSTQIDLPSEQSNFEWHEEAAVSSASTPRQRVAEQGTKPLAEQATTLLPNVQLTPIEDFDTTELSGLNRLYRKLLRGDSLVRIAFMGDSFVEADIITADLREALQSQFGGCGVGFTPMHSPHTIYRSTIKTQSEGWHSHNVMQRRKTPPPYDSLFTVSGWLSLPERGATTTWSTTSVRQNIDSCHSVRLHFLALKDCRVDLSINGGEEQPFSIKGGERLRQIELHGEAISTVTMRVASGAEGFVGYGALFEGEAGVTVDNFSVRSNNGQAMFWTNPAINAQIDKAIGGYDLVILQYGLNIMQSGVNKYTAYSLQVEKMIRYVQQCFPTAAVLVMGVSDRSVKKNGLYQPMSEAEQLTEYQRTAALNRGVAFWDTYSAMQAQGGMTTFVTNGWAAKDFTHINLKGGRQIALAMVDAINAGIERQRPYIINRVEHPAIIDSVAMESIGEALMSVEISGELPILEIESTPQAMPHK